VDQKDTVFDPVKFIYRLQKHIPDKGARLSLFLKFDIYIIWLYINNASKNCLSAILAK
jgi:hypothetical protein